MSLLLAFTLGATGCAALALAVATRVEPSVLRRVGRLAPGAASDVSIASLAARRALVWIGSVAFARRVGERARLSGTLARAAVDLSPEAFMGLKIASGLAAAVVGLLIFAGSSVIVIPVVAAAVYRVPDVLAARAARRRRERMDAELPQLLDLLAAASHAGLAGPLALRRAIAATRGPLAGELERALDAIDLGGRWRDELRLAAERTGLPDLSRAVAALTRTESLGSSLAESMTELAARVREARRAATTERARTAPVKMLFPLVFLVLPAFLLLTVAPVLLSTLRSID